MNRGRIHLRNNSQASQPSEASQAGKGYASLPPRTKISLDIGAKKYYSTVNNTFFAAHLNSFATGRRSLIYSPSFVRGNASKADQGILSETVSFKE